MIEIKLADDQTGYDAVGEYVLKYWEHHSINDAIVSIETSFDGQNYYACKEIISPRFSRYDMEYLNDWWEGEKFIRLIGITNIDELDIHGGIY